MARIPRIELPAIAQNIVQRGNDPQTCFADYDVYLPNLSAWAQGRGA